MDMTLIRSIGFQMKLARPPDRHAAAILRNMMVLSRSVHIIGSVTYANDTAWRCVEPKLLLTFDALLQIDAGCMSRDDY